MFWGKISFESHSPPHNRKKSESSALLNETSSGFCVQMNPGHSKGVFDKFWNIFFLSFSFLVRPGWHNPNSFLYAVINNWFCAHRLWHHTGMYINDDLKLQAAHVYNSRESAMQTRLNTAHNWLTQSIKNGWEARRRVQSSSIMDFSHTHDWLTFF